MFRLFLSFVPSDPPTFITAHWLWTWPVVFSERATRSAFLVLPLLCLMALARWCCWFISCDGRLVSCVNCIAAPSVVCVSDVPSLSFLRSERSSNFHYGTLAPQHQASAVVSLPCRPCSVVMVNELFCLFCFGHPAGLVCFRLSGPGPIELPASFQLDTFIFFAKLVTVS
jgi:hypothetical protein